MSDQHHNVGDYNLGNCNVGNYNAGDHNSGTYNAGNRNTGHHNVGHCNTGDSNVGNCNVGDCNSGDCNSGYYNAGLGAMTYFCTFTEKNRPYYLFNRLVSADEIKQLNAISLPPVYTSQWTTASDMTDKEKQEHPEHTVTDGFLRVIPYKEAWAIAWKKATSWQRKTILDLPGFDPVIFREITGIDLAPATPVQREIVLDGKRYALTPLD